MYRIEAGIHKLNPTDDSYTENGTVIQTDNIEEMKKAVNLILSMDTQNKLVTEQSDLMSPYVQIEVNGNKEYLATEILSTTELHGAIEAAIA